MKSKQNGVTVIILKNGDRIEVEEDALAVTAKYNEADNANNTELMRWMGSDGEEKFPQPRNQFKVTGFWTGIKVSLYPEQVYKIIVEEDEKPEEVVHDQDETFPPSDAGSTRVTLVDGREIEVEEDFDEVNVRWNAAFYGADYEPPVLSLTEKDTGSRLAILAQNIEMLEEL